MFKDFLWVNYFSEMIGGWWIKSLLMKDSRHCFIAKKRKKLKHKGASIRLIQCTQ